MNVKPVILPTSIWPGKVEELSEISEAAGSLVLDMPQSEVVG